MSRPAKLDRSARQAAGKRSRGRQSDAIPVFAGFIDDRPEALLDTIDEIAAHIAEEDRVSDLDEAHLALLSMQFEHLRYRIECGYDWARDLQGEAERKIAALVRGGGLSSSGLALIAAAMSEARLEVGPDLRALGEEVLTAGSGELARSSVDLDGLFSDLAASLGDDAFAAVDAMAKATHSLPPEARAALAGAMVARPEPVLREAAALLLLDQDEPVRRSVATTLLQRAELASPVTLRRLIAVRTWLPDPERHLVDQVVREARLKAVESARWSEVSAVSDIRASTIDGSGAQGFLIASAVGRKRRLASILVKDGVGIADAWGGEPISARELSRTLSFAEVETAQRPVSRRYLDQVVCHNLAVGLEVGRLPPPGLLQVAEQLGATDWRPGRLDWRKSLEAIVARLPASATGPAAVTQAIATSADWAAATVAVESWFEDGPEVRAIVGGTAKRLSPTLTGRVIAEVIEPRRLKWAQKFADVACWLDHGGDEATGGKFAIVARELASGRPARELPLMVDIALRTIQAAHE